MISEPIPWELEAVYHQRGLVSSGPGWAHVSLFLSLPGSLFPGSLSLGSLSPPNPPHLVVAHSSQHSRHLLKSHGLELTQQ